MEQTQRRVDVCCPHLGFEIMVRWFFLIATELFSFGELPWSNFTNEEVVKRLRRAKRLDRPVHCPDFVYAILVDCWKIDPPFRSSVSQCRDMLEQYWESNSCNVEMSYYIWPSKGSAADPGGRVPARRPAP